MSVGLIIDGYVDEPACFGVPPYISPYVRYCAGVMYSKGLDVKYFTIDQIRRLPIDHQVRSAQVIVVITGLTVPGRYRGGSPMTLKELAELSQMPRRGFMIVGGAIRSGYALKGGTRALDPSGVLAADCIATGDPEAVLASWLDGGLVDGTLQRDYGQLDLWAEMGAQVVRMHPNYPLVMAELELSRGCDRTDGRCSFCVEGVAGLREERPVESIAREVRALSRMGVKAFRLGRCANVLGYGGQVTPRGVRPSPSRIGELYQAIRDSAPDLKVLHMDNGNPKTIATFPEESSQVLEVISKMNTPGDTVSMGLESLHPEVVRKNNLKVTLEQALVAVRVVNQVGGGRPGGNGLPSLLPGLNFIVGLPGETSKTLEENRRFLTQILEEGLMVRRINIRRPMEFPGTPMGDMGGSKIDQRTYRRFKEWVRQEVDPIMFSRVAPPGTVIEDVICEERSGNLIFGRPLGSYPPLIGIWSRDLNEGEVVNVMVTGAGPRSISAVQWPMDPNRCSLSDLQGIPGIGRARAERIISRRPIDSMDQLISALDDPSLAVKVARYFAL